MDGNSSKETKGAMPADCKEGRSWIWPGVLITVTIVAIWFWGGYHKFITPWGELSTDSTADTFSGLNALFAGLAFCGLIFTILYQIKEAKATRKEIQESAEANGKMAEASVLMTRHAQQSAILELFKTYCSDYFQEVRDCSMSVLIPCVASKEYCDFVVSRFFVADQLPYPEQGWIKIETAKANHGKTHEQFREKELSNRNKLDELVSFFSLLAWQESSKEMLTRLDFSYSWWRPLLWMIAIRQEQWIDTHDEVPKYMTPRNFSEVLRRLDAIYGLAPFKSDRDFWLYFVGHPKIKAYGLDDAYKRLLKVEPGHQKMLS